MKHRGKINLTIIAEVIVLLLLCYFPLCLNIDKPVIRQWDEARNAVNTMEMLQNHNYIVRHIFDSPEIWETKPPLLIWMQIASIKIFGPNEFAIRFPTMMATFLTVMLLVYFFHKFFGNRYIGYLAALVMVTSQGYIDRHIARTGDHDALLVLFLLTIVLYFYLYITTDKLRPRILLGIAVLFISAAYTKSIASLFILPGLFISTFIFKAGKKLFLNKWLYFSIILFILVVGSYYLVREQLQPGYLNYVWKEELFPRYKDNINYSYGTFWYYAINLYTTRLTYWVYFLVSSIILLPFILKGNLRKFFLYLIIQIIVLFLIISSGTKNLWYDALFYPLFGIMISLFIIEVFNRIKGYLLSRLSPYIISLLLGLLFLFPSVKIIQKVSHVEEQPWDHETYAMGYILRDKQTMAELPKPLRVTFHGYNVHLYFYTEVIKYESGNELVKLGNFNNIQPGDAVILSQQEVMDSIQRKFSYEVITEKPPVKVLMIIE